MSSTSVFSSQAALALLLAIGVLLGGGPRTAAGQRTVQLTNEKTGEQVRRTFPKGADVFLPVTPGATAGSAVEEALVVDPSETARVIVEFEQVPAVRHRDRLAKRGVPAKSLDGRVEAHRQEVRQTLARFRRDLGAIGRGEGPSGKAAPMGEGTQITREYTEVFSGSAVTTPAWAVQRIANLPYVETTHRDRRVEAVVSDAREIVGADALEAADGATGEGVEIAIIDTGIDYNHPALGGGFGPGHKVVGGYDFVNEDDDPLDDAGHGTHVAGIAAASGPEITGIAPGATLRAYKVLGAGGSGHTSDIIAGIERAVSDGVDVINMSLGGSGTPDDPASQATDNASRAGILPVVSAGNGGPDYETIGSPGTARRALTVGASNDSDQITAFSSRGPTSDAYTVKPDVTAPGVDIRSTMRNGTYGPLSGTSMSSPVTAGAAALLLELHPDWSPSFLKGALVSTGVDIGEDIWTQGNGRIDVQSAAAARVVATPGILSFGLVDNEANQWTRTDTLTLRNRSTSSRTYELSGGPSPPAGVEVTPALSSVTVPGSDSALVPVTASVNNDVAPFPEGRPPAFTGELVATSSQDTIEVPYGIVKAPVLEITFGDHVGGSAIFVHRTESLTFKGQYSSTPEKVTIRLPTIDEYDVVAWMKSFRHKADTYVVREDIVPSEVTEISVAPRLAKHTVTTNFKDEEGRPLPHPLPRGPFKMKKATDVGIIALHTGNGQGVRGRTRFSTISDEYAISGMTRGHRYENGRIKDYRLPYYFSGISSDTTLTNDPEALRKTTYRLGDELPRALFSNLSHVHLLGPLWTTGWRAVVSGLISEPELTTPSVADMFVLPPPAENYKMYPAYRIIDLARSDIGNRGAYQTATPQIEGPDTTAFSRFVDLETGIRRPADAVGTIDLGGHPPRWAADATPGGRLDAGTDSGWFEGPFGGVRLGEVEYERYENGTLAEQSTLRNSGSVINRGIGERPLANFGAGDSLVTRFEHPVAGRTGTAEMRFAPAGDDLRSRLGEFRILSNGRASDTLASDQDNAIRAVVDSADAVAGMTASVRPADSTGWREIGSSGGGAVLEAEVPSSLQRGYHAVRVMVTGTDGGRLEHVADPAFWFGPAREGRPEPSRRLAITNYLDSLSVSWSPSFSGDVSSYRVYRSAAPIDSAAGPSNYSALASVPAEATRYVDSSVEAGTTYHYRITTVDGSGKESAFSEEQAVTARAPALSLGGYEIRFEFVGNRDGKAQAGEFLHVQLSFINETDSTLGSGTYAKIDSTRDPYVHPIQQYGFRETIRASRELAPGDTTTFQSNAQFHVAGTAPEEHVLRLPAKVFDNEDRLIALDTLQIPVAGPDATPPQIRGFGLGIQPGYVRPGEPVVIDSYVREGSRTVDVKASIRTESGQQVATIPMGDDAGTPEDLTTGDRTFTGVFVPQQEADFVVDVSATDAAGNTGRFRGASFTTTPFATSGDVLVVADAAQPWHDSYESTHTNAVDQSGYRADLWSVYVRGAPSTDLMEKYRAVVWYTGGFGIGRERPAIEQYLEGGGNLLIAGPDIAQGLRRQHANWLHDNLRATYVQRTVRRYEVEGSADDPVTDGLELALNGEAFSADEVDPTNGGVAMLTFDDEATTFQTSGTGQPASPGLRSGIPCRTRRNANREARPCPAPAAGLPGGGSAADPLRAKSATADVQSSGTAAIRAASADHRLVYLTFGLEAVKSSQQRTALVGRVLEWFDRFPVASSTRYVREGEPAAFPDAGISLDVFGMSAPDSITVEKHDEAPQGWDGIGEAKVSDYRFVIDPGENLNFDSSRVQLAVSSLSGIENPENVRLYRRDEVGSGTFTPLNTTADDGGTPTEISDDTLSAWTHAFSEFALASDTEPLPVEFVGIEARARGGAVRLQWQTASETNSAGFDVQRRVASTAGARRADATDQWTTLGFVPSKAPTGNASTRRSYTFADEDLPYAADSLTYRLRQVDADGTTSISDTVTVTREVTAVELLGTHPNPARHRATLRYAVPERQQVSIRLYDVLGRRVRTLVNGVREGRQEVSLDVSSLASGLYFLRLRTGSSVRSRRLTVVQ